MISEDQWINLPVGHNLEDHTNVRIPTPFTLLLHSHFEILIVVAD